MRGRGGANSPGEEFEQRRQATRASRWSFVAAALFMVLGQVLTRQWVTLLWSAVGTVLVGGWRLLRAGRIRQVRSNATVVNRNPPDGASTSYRSRGE